MMTEEEAKGKWCPRTIDQRDRCLASACMAWRRARPVTAPEKFDAIMEQHKKTGCSLREAKEYIDREHMRLTTGYCGLAGRP